MSRTFRDRKLWRRNKLPMIYQAEGTECALACLAMIAGYHGLEVSLLELRDRFPVSMKGTNIRSLTEVANRIELTVRPVRCEPRSLRTFKSPAILHWGFDHFVVFREVARGRYVIHDPAAGVQQLTEEEFSNQFTGVAMILAPALDFTPGARGARFSLWMLLKRSRGVLPFIAQVLWLTAFLELLALLTPLFLRGAIDAAVAQSDVGLLGAISVGCAGVAVFQAILTFLRDYLVRYFAASFNLQMMSALFRHMLRLPLDFYEKHMTGDLIDRYQGTNVIRAMFTSSLPSILLDGVMTVAAFAIVFGISRVLAVISMLGFVLYVLARIRFYGRTRTASEKAIQARSEENTHVIETLRGVRPIKIFAKENERFHVWSNYYARLVNAETAREAVISVQHGLKILILGVDTSLCMYFSGDLVVHGEITIGMLLAFFFYKAQFTIKSTLLAERLIELRLLGVHVDRLAEVALSEPESEQLDKLPVHDVRGATLSFADVSFQYSRQDPCVISNASFDIRKGEFIALIGPSGSGKTTIFKLLLGLIQPSAGQIAVNGTPLSDFDIKEYRRKFGVVMQEDLLLTGSVLDNIAFFEASPDEIKASRCARLALVWDDIDAMPMKFNTRVGDLGSALSGGQKQRILLARALYHDPEVLLLDEGTANLDEKMERKLLDNLTSLGLTCIAIAHRPETIFRATRVLCLENGRLTDVTGTLGRRAQAGLE